MAWKDLGREEWLKGGEETVWLVFTDKDSNLRDMTGLAGVAQLKTSYTAAAPAAATTNLDETKSVLASGIAAFTFNATKLNITIGKYVIGVFVTESGGTEYVCARGVRDITQASTKV